MNITIDDALTRGGTGRFQWNLLMIFGLVWAADAMQVISVGFSAPSIAASFDLTIGEAIKKTGTIFFLGMFFGAFIFGRVADRIGRRKVLLITVAMDAVFGLAAAFAPSLSWLIAFRFMTGIAVGGTLPVDYAMMAEFLPPKNRGRWLVWLEGFWAVGTIVIALTAWIAASNGASEAWRWIFGVAALPALIGFWLRLWLPESPMFLAKQGRTDELRGVVNRVLTTNGTHPLPDNTTVTATPVETGGATSIFDPALRSRSIGILAVWFLVSLSYYGVFIWMPGKLAGDGFGFVRGYGFLVILALAQIPGYALAAWGVEKWGRKPTLMGFLLASAAGCFLFTMASGATMIGGALILMSFALLGTWGALYAFTPELYPTGLRGTGMGTASAVARLGGIAAPSLLGSLIAMGFGVAIGTFAALLVLGAAALTLVRTETRDRAMG